MHVHSHFSDGFGSPKQIVDQAKKIGLAGIAITDHDSVKGGIKALEYATKDFQVITGVEISSREGHILGLDISDVPGDYLPAKEVVNFIHDRGGLAVAAHPYDRIRSGIGDLILELDFDAVEILNGHTLLNTRNPAEVCSSHGLVMVGGSDAHSPYEVGNISVRTGEKDILKAISSGKVEILSKGKVQILSGFLKSGIVKNYFRPQS
ncbi:PHP domain-containing protein [Candidatus Altiarchaeota archaeon]